MDKIKAKMLESKLKNKDFNGYTIKSLINHGKSGAVFKAVKGSKNFALKIFDNEIVEQFGHEIQIKRIEQEIKLKNHSIDNLIKIYDSGTGDIGEENFFYILMEYVDGLNLKEFIEKKQYDKGFVVKVFKTLLKTSEKLLEHSIAHRDIKPENIMINTKQEIILMDLGVLKLIEASSFTDGEEKKFVGTLRYAAPEFLSRDEEDVENGWRAINLYQIGATLHDLIMKEELFKNETPYAKLVYAIKEKVPTVKNNQYDSRLIRITRNLLSKNCERRLELCSDSILQDFFREIAMPPEDFSPSLNAIKSKMLEHEAKFEKIEDIGRSIEERKAARKNISFEITKSIDSAFCFLKEQGICEGYIQHSFSFSGDKKTIDAHHIENVMYSIKGNIKMGYLRDMMIICRLINDENYDSRISLLGILPSNLLSSFIKRKVHIQPMDIFKEINGEKYGPLASRVLGNQQIKNVDMKIEFHEIFQGVFSDDEDIINTVKLNLIKLFNQMLKIWEPEVKSELDWKESRLISKEGISTRISSGSSTILISKIE